MERTLSQAEMLDALAAIHGIVAARRPALKARVQYLQRLGVPYGVNTGKGRRAEYGIRQIVELVVAFELMQGGMWPEEITRAISQLADRLPAALVDADLSSSRITLRDIVLVTEPNSLADFTRDLGDEPVAPLVYLVECGDLDSLEAMLAGDKSRLALANLTSALSKAADHLRVLQFDEGVRAWAENVDFVRDYLSAP